MNHALFLCGCAFTMAYALPLAHAQPCAAKDNEVFLATRRARSIVSSYEAFNRHHALDLAHNVEFGKRTNQELSWRFAMVGMFELKQTYGFEVCSNQGPWGASVLEFYGGGLVGVDLVKLGVGIDAFALMSSLDIIAKPTLMQTTTPEGLSQDPQGLATTGTSETMYGTRVTLYEWGSLVGALISVHPPSLLAGDDGRRLEVPVGGSQGDRYYLGLGTAFGGGTFNLLLNDEDTFGDLAGVRFDQLPTTFDAFKGVAGASWIREEQRGMIDLGVSQVWNTFSLVTSTEFAPMRLRSVVGRAQWSGGPEAILRSTDPETGIESAMRAALDLNVFGQLSYFNSSYLERQTERSDVLGGAAGVSARADLTFLMASLDLWFGLNQPLELARVSQFVGHPQMGVRLHIRLGL